MKSTAKKDTNFFGQFYLDGHSLKEYIIPVSLFILFVLASILFFNIYQNQAIWESMKVAGGNAFEFCEFNHIGNSIVQTANTWSNLGFLLVGMFLIFLGIKDTAVKHEERANLLLKYPMFSILMGASIVYLFIGSFFYHASVTYFFQMLDQTGMYAIVFSFMGYHFFRLMPTIKLKKEVSSHKLILAICMALNLAFVFYLWDKVDVNIFFPALFLIYIIFTFVYNKRKSIVKISSRLVLLSLYVLMLSLSVWILDRQDVLCDPNSVFQGHALWHILNAVVLLFIYLHYRAENTLIAESAQEK